MTSSVARLSSTRYLPTEHYFGQISRKLCCFLYAFTWAQIIWPFALNEMAVQPDKLSGAAAVQFLPHCFSVVCTALDTSLRPGASFIQCACLRAHLSSVMHILQAAGNSSSAVILPVDVEDVGDAYNFIADVPGLEKGDIKVNIPARLHTMLRTPVLVCVLAGEMQPRRVWQL